MPRLIDADALMAMPLVLPNRMTRKTALECFRNIVAEVPTIEAEPVRHGWWKRYIEDWRHQIDYHECSVCGFKYGGLGVEFFHYCPNCGTPMDRKEANAPAKEPNKVCPINNAPCNECVPGAHCAKMDGGAAHD